MMDNFTVLFYLIAILEFILLFAVRKTAWIWIQRTVFRRKDWPTILFYAGGTRLKKRLFPPYARKIRFGRGEHSWEVTVSGKSHLMEETGDLVYLAVKGHPETFFLGDVFKLGDTSGLISTGMVATYATGYKDGLGNIANLIKRNLYSVVLTIVILVLVVMNMALGYQVYDEIQGLKDDGVKVSSFESNATQQLIPASGPPDLPVKSGDDGGGG